MTFMIAPSGSYLNQTGYGASLLKTAGQDGPMNSRNLKRGTRQGSGVFHRRQCCPLTIVSDHSNYNTERKDMFKQEAQPFHHNHHPRPSRSLQNRYDRQIRKREIEPRSYSGWRVTRIGAGRGTSEKESVQRAYKGSREYKSKVRGRRRGHIEIVRSFHIQIKAREIYLT